MKPDKKLCKNCGEEINRGKYCSDKCRKADKRKSDKVSGFGAEILLSRTNPDKPGQKTRTKQSRTQRSSVENHGVIPNDETRTKLTETDRTFYDRAMKDFEEPYYRFGEAEVHDEVCIMEGCGKRFKTSLKLLRYCSYQHYSDAIAGRRAKRKK